MLAAIAPEVLAAAATTIPELSAIGLTGAEIAAATPAMGAMAGSGLSSGATVASLPWAASALTDFPAMGLSTEAPTMSWFERLAANPGSALLEALPSRETLGTVRDVGMIGSLGKTLLTPPPARQMSAPPSLPSGSTRGYQPTTTEPIQRLANLMAQRRQATAQRRFA